ncbi:TonB-dependent receptor [Porphyrobacter sp. TH134]|uniref:TonB-dependent receptor n=1 Tax=Porphyrobacter sp. TH134 TaxID=2067450 RepID=UPI000C7C70B8|nr:TonB-dependent receptor [Porphyrobacter sp. TH134]PLK24774.1 TonB-dependent receptor [Porphyrobacter sp. TH134]
MRSTITGTAGSYRFILLAGAAAAALALPGTALAQDAGDQADAAEAEADIDTGNQIIVTATKRAQTLQDTPVAVSVTTAETIEQAQIRDIADISSVVPSLRVSQLQSAFATTFSVRGFGTDGNNLGLEPSVAVFVDGVYRSRAVSQISDLPNLQRVEVLRGPQSTLFGKNASAGVISLVTKAPSFELEGSAEVSYGNYDAMVARGYISGPLSDTIAASIAGGINKRDGFVTNGFNGDDLNDRNRWFGRADVLFDNNENFTFRVIGDWDELDEKCCAVANLRPAAETGLIQLIGGRVNAPGTELDDVVFTDVVPFNKVRNWGVSGQADYEFGNMALTSITAYRDTRIRANQDVDFTSAALATGANIGQSDIKTFTQELRLASDFDGPLNFLLGGYYFNEDLETADQILLGRDFRAYANGLVQAASGGALNVAALENLFGAAPGTYFADGTGFFNEFRQENEAYSIFGQLDFDVTDRLTLTVGANYTKDAKDVTSNGRTTDAFSQVNLVTAGGRVLTNQAIATQVGNALGLGRLATAAEIGGFATNPATAGFFPAIQAGATAFGQLNAGLTPAQAAADANPLTTGNPFLGLAAFQFLPPIVNIPNAVEDGRTRDDKVTYLARASYEVTDTLNAYISYATGFKASSFNLTRDSRPLPGDFSQIISQGIGVPNLRPGTRFALPEESTVYEVGLKGNWGIAGANFTVFLQTLENFQSNTFVGNSFVLANAGELETFGIEFDGYVKPTDSLTLNLALTYLEPEYKSFPGSPVGDLSGQTVQGIHPLSASFGATWDKELANGDRFIARGDYQYEAPIQVLDGLTNFVGVNLDGSQNFDAARLAARPFVREVNNVNASVTYALAMGLEFTLWARNLTDNRYITTIFPSVAQGQSISGYPNQPRTYGGLVRFRF